MDNNTIKLKIETEDDFIYCPRLGNSLKKLIEKNPDGVDESRIAKVLLISEEEVKELFDSAISKIRNLMEIEELISCVSIQTLR